MLFRSRIPTPLSASRFRPQEELFAFRKEGELFVAEIAGNGERSVDLFHSLAGEMPDVVNFSMECLRSGRSYIGEGLRRDEVVEAIARLKVPLVASAGVELSVVGANDQLSLSAMLDCWIFAKADLWLALLVDRGLEEAAELPRRSWTVKRGDFTGAPELVAAVTAAAERLTLTLT